MLSGDYIDQVYIHIFGHDIMQALERVDSHPNLWRFATMLPADLNKYNFAYKYSFVSTKRQVAGQLSSKNPLFCEERFEKYVGSKTNYDVFHFPEDNEYMSETVPNSLLFYLQWLLQFVDAFTITKILSQIEKFRFITFCPKHVKKCVNWIVDLAPSVTEVQRLYLYIVLSHLFSSRSLSPLLLPNDIKTTVACDCLLQCLDVDPVFLSRANREHLEKTAILLVQHSSRPGWLTLAAHFCPYLGVEFILSTVDAVGLTLRYEATEYRKMVDALLSTVKTTNDLDAHQELMYFVLESAPTLVVALELFENSNVCRLFTNEDERAQFFVEFCENAMRSRGTSTQWRKSKLTEFYNIPEKLRGRIRKYLPQILLEYTKSDDELDDEHVKIFVDSIISERLLHDDQVLYVLMQLSKSKSVPRQNLLLEILNNECFRKRWHETSKKWKVDICKSWVITTVVNTTRRGSFDNVNNSKIATAYEAIDKIMKCSLNIKNKDLAEHVSESLASTILREENVVSFVQASVSIGECSEIVQMCYKSHVSKILAKASKADKIKSTMLLKECSGSRYTGLEFLYRFQFQFLKGFQFSHIFIKLMVREVIEN